MNIQEALNILGVTEENVDFDTVKLAFRRACIKFHPDRNPGGTEMMKIVNAAWKFLQSVTWGRGFDNKDASNASYGDELMEFINSVINLDGIEIEICGSWVWVDGETYPHKAAIKAAGGRWSGSKKKWYYRPAASKVYRKSKRVYSMDAIRLRHGSKKVAKPSYTQISHASA